MISKPKTPKNPSDRRYMRHYIAYLEQELALSEAKRIELALIVDQIRALISAKNA